VDELSILTCGSGPARAASSCQGCSGPLGPVDGPDNSAYRGSESGQGADGAGKNRLEATPPPRP